MARGSPGLAYQAAAPVSDGRGAGPPLQALHALWPHPPLHQRLALLLSNRAAALLSQGKPLRCEARPLGLSYARSWPSDATATGPRARAAVDPHPCPWLQRAFRLPDGAEVRPFPHAMRAAGGHLPWVSARRGAVGKPRAWHHRWEHGAVGACSSSQGIRTCRRMAACLCGHVAARSSSCCLYPVLAGGWATLTRPSASSPSCGSRQQVQLKAAVRQQPAPTALLLACCAGPTCLPCARLECLLAMMSTWSTRIGWLPRRQDRTAQGDFSEAEGLGGAGAAGACRRLCGGPGAVVHAG